MSDHVVITGSSEYHISDQKKYDELIDFLEANAEVVVEREVEEEENKDLLIQIDPTDGVHTGPKIEEVGEDEDED